MSLQTWIQGVEAKLKAAFVWVEGKTDTALTFLWEHVEPVIAAEDPVIIQQTLQAVIDFMQKAEAAVLGGSSDDIEQAFIEDLEVIGSDLLDDAKGLGSSILQILIGLAKGKLASA